MARLVTTNKIAPRYKGAEEEDAGEGASECPICFLYYAEVNHVTCCNNDICTECYLQVKLPSGSSTCPFCNRPALEACYEMKRNAAVSTNSQQPDNAKSGVDNTAQQRFPSSPPPSASASATTSQSTTPLSSSPPSASSTPVVVSIAERQQLEQAMQSQRVGSEYSTPSGRSRSNSTGSGSSSYRSHSSGRLGQGVLSGGSRHGSRRRNGRRSSETRGRLNIDGVHDLDRYYQNYGGEEEEEEENQFDMQFNIDQVEEMMVMEAIRLSMLESESGNVSSTQTVDVPPPPPPPYHVTHKSEDAVKVSDLKSAGVVDENNANDKFDMSSTSVLEDKTLATMGNVDEKEDVTLKSSNVDLLKHDINVNDNDDNDDNDDDDDDDARMLELALSLSVALSATDSSNVTENAKEESPPLKSFTQLETNSGSNILSTNLGDDELVFQVDDIQKGQCTSHSDIKLESQNDGYAGNNDDSVMKIDAHSCTSQSEELTTTEHSIREGCSLTPSAKVLVDRIDRALSDTSHCTNERDSGNSDHCEDDSIDQLNRALFGDDDNLNDSVEDKGQLVSEDMAVPSPNLVDNDVCNLIYGNDDDDNSISRTRSSTEDNEESDDDRDVRIIKSSS